MLVTYNDPSEFHEAEKKDMQFFFSDQDRYDQLIEEREEIWKSEFNKFTNNMCVEYPKHTKEELESQIKSDSVKLSFTHQVSHSDEMVEYFQKKLEDRLTKYQNVDYIVTKEEREYREFYEAKREEFFGVFGGTEAYKEFRKKVDALIEQVCNESEPSTPKQTC